MENRLHILKCADLFKSDPLQDLLRIFDVIAEVLCRVGVRSDGHYLAAEVSRDLPPYSLFGPAGINLSAHSRQS